MSKFDRGGHYSAEQQPTEIYAGRRRRLAEKLGSGTVVLWGAGDERGYGDVGTFRQDPDFYYLTGVELPNAVLVLRPSDGEDLLFIPPRNEPLEQWTGPKLGPGEETARLLGFSRVLSTGPSEIMVEARRRPVPGFEGRLIGWLSEADAVLWTRIPSLGAAAELSPELRLLSQLKERLPSFVVRDISPELASMRLVKDAGEAKLMRRAAAATIAGMRAAARTIRPGVTEKAVEGAVFGAFTAAGAEGLAFPSIVGSGFNGTVLHYDQNSGTCQEGDLVVVDIGARYGYYCGDLTRTFPVSGRFNDRQRELYELVLAAHDAVAAAIRPGVTLGDLRKIAYDILQGSKLRDAQGRQLGEFFIHGLGHFLGLEAHDSGGEGPQLEPGMVITNEPGIYLPEEGIGIRIEDDYLVTTEGAECLSKDLPSTPDAIEAMMRGD